MNKIPHTLIIAIKPSAAYIKLFYKKNCKKKCEIYIKKTKMRIIKSHSLLKLINAYLIDASQPSNISYL